MPDSSKPVFIDQMPEYQEALANIRALSRYPQAFKAAMDELNLGKEWQQNNAAIDALRPQAQTLIAQQASLIDRHGKAASHNASIGNVVATGSGVTTGVIGYQRWGIVKGALLGFATSLMAKFVYSQVNPQPAIADDKAIEAIKEQKLQLAAQALELQKPFIETMATRMLEQQKALEGMGEDMKLVSTKNPAQSHAAKVTRESTIQSPAR